MNKINPRVDIAFKKIFGAEGNEDLLISLINSIVGPDDQVSEVTLLNPYNEKSFREDKLSILDIKAKNLEGKRFNIEMQITDEADYDKRALYYWAKIYAEQLKTSENYSQLEKAIGIHILNFHSIPGAMKYHNIFHITEKETGLKYFKDLELHTIELSKFINNTDKTLNEIVGKVKNALDMWSTFLMRTDLLNPDNLPKELDDENLKKAIHVLNVMNFSEKEREFYEGQRKWMMIEENALEKREKQGIEIGREQGREEMRRSNALNMLRKGLSIDIISQCTGLSLEEIALLANKVDGS